MARFPRSRLCLIATALTLTALPASNVDAEPRTWKDSTGKFSVEAEFAGIIAGEVRLRKVDGTAVSVPLDRLSQADRDWIQDEIDRPKVRPRAVSKEEREAEEEALRIAAENAKKSEAAMQSAKNEREWYRSGFKIPEDFERLHVFEVEGGHLAVTLSTPVYYVIAPGRFVGAELRHSFVDGEQVHDSANGFYLANGRRFVVERGSWSNGTNGQQEYCVEAAGQEFHFPFYVRVSPVQEGESVETVLGRLGEPDQKRSYSLGSQVWSYDRFPYLQITVRDGKVILLSGSPRDGEAELLKWMKNLGYKPEAP